MFHFKQFSVDQTGCAMKINTDGVLLGAIAKADHPKTILDIGTGTGVIALMLAQRFTDAEIDAVEIEPSAAQTAERNFKVSPFADRLKVYPTGFEPYFNEYPDIKYDLIVSNPPFYVGSLKSPGPKKALAKHTDIDFFERLIKAASIHLTPSGCFWLILPVNIAEAVVKAATINGLHLQRAVSIKSYADSAVHRAVLCFGFNEFLHKTSILTIYKSQGIYSLEYQHLLQPYFLAF